MTARLALAGTFLLFIAPAWAQEPPKPAPARGQEAALTAVAKHLSPPYALYLYESLTAQILYNEHLLERPASPLGPKAGDSVWALEIISQSILVDGTDGQYVDVRRVPAFFEDIVHRYMDASHYWPDREVTPDTRREHLAAWYSLYLMLLVGNATQDEIARKLRSGAFNLDPGMLETGEQSLVDRLRKDGALTDDAYALVQVRRKGPEGRESLTFPAYLDRWKAKIDDAYKISPGP